MKKMVRTMCKKNRFMTVLAIALILFAAGSLFPEESNAVSNADLNIVTITSISSYDGKIHVEWKSNNPAGTRVVAHYGEGDVHAESYLYPDYYGVDHKRGSMDIKTSNVKVGRTYNVYLETYYDGVGSICPSSGYKSVTVRGGSSDGRYYEAISKGVWHYDYTVDDDAVYYEFKTSGRADSKYHFACRGTGKKSVNMWLLNYGASPNDDDAWRFVACGTKDSSSCTTKTLALKPNRTYRLRAYFKYGWTDTPVNAVGGVQYRLKVTEIIAKPAKGRIISWTAGKKKATVKYVGLKKATRYQIAYKVKGGKYKYMYTKSKVRTIKGLKSKKIYYVKVRGQRLANGKYHSGAWSAARKVKIK